MDVNSFNALPRVKKIRGRVYSIPHQFRIIVAVRQKCPALAIKARSTEVP
jgi:hypothetical protein